MNSLSVRFLTRRYIGEYDHKTEGRYKHEVLVDNDPILYEILDTCPKSDNDFPTNDTINWADGLLLVYSINDRKSFSYLKKVGALISDSDIPVYVVANKNDMELCRAVLAARRKSKHSLLERMLGSKSSNLRLYVRGKSDSALPKD
ncbi:hypothetical protein GWI33_000621 [Rhynchophorus ferrugineus]|uniref:small monomeric GTPase n=1 Tax=Rhynchophorus ferrugineus TaxID=354439 RepID=A0A834IT80_RHYFE|nr:hypothetical protein GWI33_000621 [Rhynchophorus ferrugineus]